MIIELLVDTANHKAGTKLDIDADYAIRLIRNGNAKKYVEATDVPFEPVEEKPIEPEKVEPVVPDMSVKVEIISPTVEPKAKKVPKKAPKKKAGKKPVYGTK